MSKAPKRAPVTVNRLNNLFADLRGAPVPTIEMYSRNLRKADVLPETKRGAGAGIEPVNAAQMLIAIMRGSPVNATANAVEMGGLIVHGTELGGGLAEPILDAALAVIGWKDSMTFAGAIGSLIDRIADGTMNEIAEDPATLRVEVDRYWTSANLRWMPSQALADALFESSVLIFGEDAARRLYDRLGDNKHRRPVTLSFASRHLFDAKDSYRTGDKGRNKAAHAAHLASKEEAQRTDLIGSETVTYRTIAAIADLFKASR